MDHLEMTASRGASESNRENSAQLRALIADLISTFAGRVDGLHSTADLDSLFEGASEDEVCATLGHINKGRAVYDALDKRTVRLACERLQQLKKIPDIEVPSEAVDEPAPAEPVAVAPRPVGTKREFRLKNDTRLSVAGSGQIKINDRPVHLRGQKEKIGMF